MFNLFLVIPRDDQARQGRTGLATVEENGIEAHADSLFVVCPLQEDERRLAAQFHADALHRPQGALGYLDAGCRRTRKGYHGNIRVVADGIADLAAPAGDEIEDALGETGPVKGFGRHRRMLARLEDDCRPDEQGWNDFLDNLP